MNGLYLVCDGGGTKTDFLLFEKTGRVRGRAQGAGANANFGPPAEAAHTVYAGVMECLAQAGAAPAQVREFVLFIPGFRPALPELETLLGSGNVRQLGDEKNAFYAALGAPCGIAVLSGTGSFATGRDKAGRTATAGGWGPLFSDEGSGYHIGVLCLSRLALLHDTHVTGTLLEKNVLEMLGMPDVLSIRDAAYRPDFTRRHVARLSYAVERSAREGDANACAVLDEAACALARLAATVAGQLDAHGRRGAHGRAVHRTLPPGAGTSGTPVRIPAGKVQPGGGRGALCVERERGRGYHGTRRRGKSDERKDG